MSSATVFAGVVTFRSSDVPAPQDDITYSAVESLHPTDPALPREVFNVHPICRPIPPGQNFIDVIPAALNSPCLMMHVSGAVLIWRVNERPATGECEPAP